MAHGQPGQDAQGHVAGEQNQEIEHVPAQ